MLPDIAELKARRKRFGLTQAGVAAKTGVSQSLIAKIESGKAVPSYTNAKRLFDFYESLHDESQARARDFMSRHVIGLSPKATLREAVRVMKKNAVSQLPVMEDGRNLGTISEKDVLDRLNDAHDLNEVSALMVSEAMTEAMPTLRDDTPFKAVSALLEHNTGALVVKGGKIVGIVTKSDLLNAVLQKQGAGKGQ